MRQNSWVFLSHISSVLLTNSNFLVFLLVLGVLMLLVGILVAYNGGYKLGTFLCTFSAVPAAVAFLIFNHPWDIVIWLIVAQVACFIIEHNSPTN